MRIFFETDLRGKPPEPFKRGKKGIYSIRQRIGGKDVWRSLGTTDKREAEFLALEIWRARQTALMKSIIPVAPVPLLLLWERYEQTERFELLEESTRQKRKNIFRAFVEFCSAHKVKYASEVTREIAEAFLLGDGTRKNHTFNNMLSDLANIYSAIEEEHNPFEAIQRKSTTRGSRASEPYAALTRQQISAILWAIRRSGLKNRREWFDACIVALNTGARYKDIALLRFDVLYQDSEGEYLMFAPAKTAKITRGRVVTIRATPKLSALINRRHRQIAGDYIFPGLAADYHKPITARRTTTPLGDMLRSNGIFGSFHCFRTTVITAAARAGIDLKEFGGVVGHSTESQTMAYNRAALRIDMRQVTAHI